MPLPTPPPRRWLYDHMVTCHIRTHQYPSLQHTAAVVRALAGMRHLGSHYTHAMELLAPAHNVSRKGHPIQWLYSWLCSSSSSSHNASSSSRVSRAGVSVHASSSSRDSISEHAGEGGSLHTSSGSRSQADPARSDPGEREATTVNARVGVDRSRTDSGTDAPPAASATTTDLPALPSLDPRQQPSRQELADFVAVIPSTTGRLQLAHASRVWRRGMRTAIAINCSEAAEQLTQTHQQHGETYTYYPDEALTRCGLL